MLWVSIKLEKHHEGLEEPEKAMEMRTYWLAFPQQLLF